MTPSMPDRLSRRESHEAWKQAVRRHPHDADVLANAGDVAMLTEPNDAEEWLLRAIQLRPNSASIWFELARLYRFRGDYPLGEDDAEDARLAFWAVVQGLRVATTQERLHDLPDCALIAFWAGALEQAAAWASYSLSQIAHVRGTFYEGNVIHDAHRALGHVALRRGDVASAKRHLLASAAGPSSPQLASFGPKMSLARELLDRGERDTVLEYLRACGRIWTHPRGRLDAWIATIEAGVTPERFGGDLF